MSIKTVSGALDVLNTKVGGTAGDIPADATKVDALKKLYATLGGSPETVEDISTISEMVEALAEVAQGGGDSVQVESLSVTANGTYSEDGKAYSPVIVNVPAAAFTKHNCQIINQSSVPVEAAYAGIMVVSGEQVMLAGKRVFEAGQSGYLSVIGGSAIKLFYDGSVDIQPRDEDAVELSPGIFRILESTGLTITTAAAL